MARLPSTQTSRRFVRECLAVTAMLAVAYLWRRLVQRLAQFLLSTLDVSGPILLTGLVAGGLFVGGLALFVWWYTAYRGIDVELTAPSRPDLPVVALAASVPPVLVGVTKLVGVVTGVPYNSLTMTYYRAGTSLDPILVVVGLSSLIAVPTLVLSCQVVVQRSFGRLFDGRRAVVVTTLVTWFVMLNGTGALRTVPERGKLAGAVVFTALLGISHYVSAAVERETLRYVAYAPVALFVAVAVVSAVTQIGSLAAGLFGLTHVAVLAIAAYTYERSDSLVVPALAYLSVTLANYGVVVAFEMGVGPS